MAEYRFAAKTFGGTGTITVNGYPPNQFYEEGTTIEIEVIPDNGFTFATFNFNNGYLTSATNPYTFPMPSRDLKGKVNLTGSFSPTPDGYAIRYFNEFCDEIGQEIRFEILQDGYAGYPEKVLTQSFKFTFGDFGQDEIKPLMRSFLDFVLVGEKDEFIEILDGGYRKWQVKMFIESNLFWTGYVNSNFLTLNEIEGRQAQKFTASDGINAFESKRVIDQLFASFLGGTTLGALFASLNQTFPELRPLNVACDIYETRLDRDLAMFDQLLTPANAVFTDGEMPIYVNGIDELNDVVYISQFLDAILKPFLCRVFLWKNEWYIISTPELAKSSYRLFKYDNEGVFDELVTVSDFFELGCNFTNGQRTARSIFTEFTAVLKLGVLDYSSRGGIYDEPFSIDSWFVNSPSSPYPGVYQLRKWNYVNAIPANRPASFPVSTNPALVQYATDTLSDRVKIWGTTGVTGTSDTNLSYIELDSTRTGQDIPILQELANKLSITYEFAFEARYGDPVRANTNHGVQIQIGNSYLQFDGVDEFTWTLTPTIIQFPMTNVSLYTWNTVEIVDVTVPEDGNLFVRFYEVITTNPDSVNRYTVAIAKLEIKIEENDAFVTEEIGFKFITDTSYSSVYSDIDLKIGDVPTANSTTAIKLNLAGEPASVAWSRDGIESLPLMQIFLQEVANIKGNQNPRIIATVLRDKVNPIELKPYQRVQYDGFIWMIIALEFNFSSNDWRIELAQIAPITS